MSLSRLSARCRVCPHVDTCDHKEMEAYGFLPIPPQQGSIIFSEPSESSAQQTAKGYRSVKNFWTNPHLLIMPGSNGSTPVGIETSGEIRIDVDKLIRAITRAAERRNLNGEV